MISWHIYYIQTGEILKIYDYMSQAKAKTHKGFDWKYVDD